MHRMRSDRQERLAAWLAVVLVWAGPAFAVDGVIEINQARALAGGVTDDDTAGFPVTIGAPGSYRLTSDLTVASENETGVFILTSNVTLDLNGFSIIGPVVCTTATPVSQTSCTPSSGGGVGVQTSGSGFFLTDLTVRNGTIRGMGNDGIKSEVLSGARIERIRAVSNAGNGISVGLGAVFDSANVTGCSAIRNGEHGISAPEGSVITGNVANHNHLNGIVVDDGSVVTGNVVNRNDQVGISAGSGVVSDNTVIQNASFGLDGGVNVGYANNVFHNNNVSGGGAQVDTGPQEIGTNICNADTTCP